MTASVARRSLHRWLLAPVLLAFGLGLFGAPGPAHAGKMISQSFFGGVAISGYDPVAYFTEGRAVEGSEEITYAWLGATWHFVSAEHRDLFAADPMKYAPQYGGYCSSGVTGGSLFGSSPEAWRIVDGKLYLVASKASLTRWERDIPGKIARADGNWERLKVDLTE